MTRHNPRNSTSSLHESAFSGFALSSGESRFLRNSDTERPGRPDRVPDLPGRSLTPPMRTTTTGKNDEKRDDAMRATRWNPRERAARLVIAYTDGWRGELVTPLIPRDADSPLRSALLNERAVRLSELRMLDFRVYDTIRIEEAGPGDNYRIIDRFKVATGLDRPV